MSADLPGAIMTMLDGHSAQKPMPLGNIVARLPAELGADVLADALDELVARRAINTARVSQDGVEFRPVYWLTGVPPAPMPRGITINKYTQADARAAHEAQARAEASREGLSTQAGACAVPTPLKSPLAPLCKGGKPTPETDMPRIAKPAQPVTERPQAEPAQPAKSPRKPSRPYIKAADGAVIGQVLATLAGRSRENALATDELLALCPAAASVGSLRSTLRTLSGRGQVSTDSWKARGKLRNWWWAAEPLNDGHEKNLATLRRLRADDHIADAGKVIPPGRFDAGPLGGGDIHAPDPLQAVAEALDLDAPGTTRFALWDDGQLLVAAGDDMIVLDAGSTRRLAGFLESCMGL